MTSRAGLQHSGIHARAEFAEPNLIGENCTAIGRKLGRAESGDLRNPESQQEWPSRDAIVQRIEEVAMETGLHLLYAAATRTRLTIVGKSQGNLDTAIAMAEERRPRMMTDSERFLIVETIGRQLA